MSDITIEGKNIHDIDQTNFQSVGPYTDENEVVEPWQGRNVINGEDQDGRFELGTFTENERNFWELNTINPITRTSQFTDRKIHIVETNIADNGMVLPKEQKWSVDNYIFTQRNGKNYPLYFYYDENLHQEEYEATTEGEVNLRFELRESGRSVTDFQMDNFISRDPFRPFLLSAVLSGSLLRKDRWQDSVIEGEGFYDKGSAASIECIPSEFSHFINWTDKITGEVVFGSSVYPFDMPLNNVELSANLMHNTVIKVTPRIEGEISDNIDVDIRISDQTGENFPATNVIPFTAGEVETLSARPGHRLLIAVRPTIEGVAFNGFKILRGSGNEVSTDPYHNLDTGYYRSSGGTGPGNPYDEDNNISEDNPYYGSYFRYFEVAPTQLYEDDGLDELQLFADFIEVFMFSLVTNLNASFSNTIENVMKYGLGLAFFYAYANESVGQDDDIEITNTVTEVPIRNYDEGVTYEEFSEHLDLFLIEDTGFEQHISRSFNDPQTTEEVYNRLYTLNYPNGDFENETVGYNPGIEGDPTVHNNTIVAPGLLNIFKPTTVEISHQFQQLGMFIEIQVEPELNIIKSPELDSESDIIRLSNSDFPYNMYEISTPANIKTYTIEVESANNIIPVLTVEIYPNSNNYEMTVLEPTEYSLHGIEVEPLPNNTSLLKVEFEMPFIAQLQSEILGSIANNTDRSKFYRFKISQGEQ